MNVGLHELPELRDRGHVFADRTDAGAKLAPLLEGLRGTGAVLLAVPAGGVSVAVELHRLLGLQLEVAVVSKVTLPWNSEVGCGAVAFDDTLRLDEGLVERVGLTGEALREAIDRTRAKVARRVALLQRGQPKPPVEGRVAVLVDDGVASGFTLRLAAEVVRRAGATRVHLAVPTGPLAALESLLGVADDVYCANVRTGYRFAVADAYRTWFDEDDETVARTLIRAAQS